MPIQIGTPPPGYIASGPQPVNAQEEPLNLLGAGAIAAGVVASGFIPVGQRRLWDYYLKAIRSVETATPGAVLRTFRVSETFSPLETWKKVELSPEFFRGSSVFSDYLRRSLGEGVEEATITKTGKLLGQVRGAKGELLGYSMQIASGTQRGAAIADYFARMAGVDLGADLSMSEGALRSVWDRAKTGLTFNEFKELLPYESATDILAQKQPRIPLIARLRPEISILGQKIGLSPGQQKAFAQAEVMTNFFRARMASTVGRLNNLLQKPFDIPILGKILSKIPIINDIAIKPGTHTSMVGRYIKKGLMIGGAWKGLEYYDYLRASGSPMAPVVGTAAGALAGGILFRKSKVVPFSKTGMIAGAAVGLYTGLAPKFDQGLYYGIGRTIADMNVRRAAVAEATGLNESLRKQDRVTPGLISVKTMLGFGGVGALIGGTGGYGKLLFRGARQKISNIKMPTEDLFDVLRVSEKSGFADWWGRTIGRGLSKIPLLGKSLAGIKSPGAAGFVAGVGAWLGLSSGLSLLSGNFMASIPVLNLLGTKQTPTELEDVYSGRKEVPVRKGRFWEFGRSSAYEGGNIQYYRPGFLERLRTRAYEKGLWGSEEEKWAHDPVLHPLKALFGGEEWKYYYEKKYQYERPAPLTGTYGSEVPFVGPLLAATVGKALKPRKYVRPEEWMLGEGEFVNYPGPRPETEPSYELGGLSPGAPVLPEEGSQLFNELLYRRREAVGLMGFAAGSLTKAISGREELLANQQTFGTMGAETGGEYWLWKHLNLGGALATSEAVRRFIPHRRSYLDDYNPLEAKVPSWFPRDYFMDLRHGNPFDIVPEAELRLPGPGYEARFPELRGTKPEDYPLIHRLKILSDVAQWSPEYDVTLEEAMARREEMSEYELGMLETIREQVKAKKKRRDISEYRFKPELLEKMPVTVKDILNVRKFTTEEYGNAVVRAYGVGAALEDDKSVARMREMLAGKTIDLMVPALESRRWRVGQHEKQDVGIIRAVPMVDGKDLGTLLEEEGIAAKKPLGGEFEQIRYSAKEQLAGKLWEIASRATETPLEYLTPASPSAKLIRKRSAVEEYIASEAVGTNSAFWDRPIENFIVPAKEMMTQSVGDIDIPDYVQQRRAISEYFDILQYIKSERLEKQAMNKGLFEEASVYAQEKSMTLFGLNPFDNPRILMKAFPRRERDFFAEFTEAQNEEERRKIFEIVPREEQRIYLARWMGQEAESIRAKIKAGKATNIDLDTATEIFTGRASEGETYDKALEEEWLRETGGKMPFADWLKNRRLKKYFSTRSLPGTDWIGWHPSVDLKDIEAKYLQTEGLDFHDFDIWEDRMKSLSRKPYIDGHAVKVLEDSEGLIDRLKEETRLMDSAKTLNRFVGGSGSANIRVSRVNANIGNKLDIVIADSRQRLVEDSIDMVDS